MIKDQFHGCFIFFNMHGIKNTCLCELAWEKSLSDWLWQFLQRKLWTHGDAKALFLLILKTPNIEIFAVL